MGEGRDARGAEELRRRFLRPEPQVEEGRVLRDLASAAIDVSDGLVLDARPTVACERCGHRARARAAADVHCPACRTWRERSPHLRAERRRRPTSCCSVFLRNVRSISRARRRAGAAAARASVASSPSRACARVSMGASTARHGRLSAFLIPADAVRAPDPGRSRSARSGTSARFRARTGAGARGAGTFGTLLGVPIALGLARLGLPAATIGTAVLFLAGIYLCGRGRPGARDRRSSRHRLGRSRGLCRHRRSVQCPPSWPWWLAAFPAVPGSGHRQTLADTRDRSTVSTRRAGELCLTTLLRASSRAWRSCSHGSSSWTVLAE